MTAHKRRNQQIIGIIDHHISKFMHQHGFYIAEYIFSFILRQLLFRFLFQVRIHTIRLSGNADIREQCTYNINTQEKNKVVCQ